VWVIFGLVERSFQRYGACWGSVIATSAQQNRGRDSGSN